MFEMKKEYYTGIELIDNEHKRLFEIANEGYALLMDKFVVDKYDGIVAIIQELKDYTKMHFQHEEEYMESIQYKRMFTQKVQHQNFIMRLEEIDLTQIDENQEISIIKIIDFLGNWLVDHILECDILIGK